MAPSTLLESPCFAYKPKLSAACQDSLSFSVDDKVLTDRGNFAGGYPPLYYGVMHLLAGPDFQLSILLMRFANILIFVGLLVATYLALPTNRRGVLVWSFLITTIPLGMFIVASNNPSSWAFIGVGISWIAFLGVLETSGPRRLSLAMITILATAVAAGSRADAAVYCGLGFLAVLVITSGTKWRFSRPSLALIGILTILAVICGYYYLSTTQAVSAINGFGNPVTAVGGFGGAVESVSVEKPSAFALAAFNVLNSPMLWAGIFGSWGLGWLDTDLPSLVYLGSLAAFVSVAFIGFGNLTKKKLLTLAALGIALWALPVYVLTKGGAHIGMEVQPRYMLPLITLLAGVILLRVRTSDLALTRGQAYLVATALTLGNFVALHFNMRRYITGIGTMGWNLNDGVDWWWTGVISPMAVLLIGSVAFGLVAFGIAREINLGGPNNPANKLRVMSGV